MNPATPNIETVWKLGRLWGALDLEGIVGLFAADAVYHSLPGNPVTGQSRIRDTIRPWIEATTSMHWEFHNIAETAEGVVLAERTDTFVMNGISACLPVTGVFEISQGRITAWRDYYDEATVTRQMTAR